LNKTALIEKLGFETTDKVVIFHIDDVGFSHSSNLATFECLDFGVASCGSVIVPAPWFLEAASICKKQPSYDMGVHLSLTCEYDFYRWRALSSVDPKTGLLDSERSLWRTAEEAVANVNPQAAEIEMRTQVQTALDSGIDVTHIDTHMGTVMDPKFLPSYLKLAREFKVAAFLPRVSREDLENNGFGHLADVFLKMFDKLEENNTPILDYMIIDTMGESPNKTDYYCKRFSEIKPGITHFLFHAAKMSTELNAIVPETAKWRDLDYQAFLDPKVKECVEKHNLKIIGYRDIRDIIRKES
jgi:predicted glycoside hydrolase/deacetylase ChbG (UPF0249 family)